MAATNSNRTKGTTGTTVGTVAIRNTSNIAAMGWGVGLAAGNMHCGWFASARTAKAGAKVQAGWGSTNLQQFAAPTAWAQTWPFTVQYTGSIAAGHPVLQQVCAQHGCYYSFGRATATTATVLLCGNVAAVAAAGAALQALGYPVKATAPTYS